jgi:hypothetical protein
VLIYNSIKLRKGVRRMKIVTLCSGGTCCPVVKVIDERVEIGEEGNLCVLTPGEWEALKSKILSNEI